MFVNLTGEQLNSTISGLKDLNDYYNTEVETLNDMNEQHEAKPYLGLIYDNRVIIQALEESITEANVSYTMIEIIPTDFQSMIVYRVTGAEYEYQVYGVSDVPAIEAADWEADSLEECREWVQDGI